jgi:saccharopine dehydrogenase-like NADP-dependent oxidoreductase
MADRAKKKPPTLLIVGGYGLVGKQVARSLRQRHPDLGLVLGGRYPEQAQEFAASIGASTVAVDTSAKQPLAAVLERPTAVLASVSDPTDQLLIDAARQGLPIADINRGGHASVLDATIAIAGEPPRAPVLLSGSWMAGTAALLTAAVVRELGEVVRVDITALASSDDEVGPDSQGFGHRLAWPYYPMRDGKREATHPLTGVRKVRCADGNERPAALVGTLEQITLPRTLGVPTVETRLALQDPASLYALIGLKRTGILRALTRPFLHSTRAALLERPGAGDFAGITVTARGPGRSVTVDVLDPRGQAHLSSVGAVLAAERVLGLAGHRLPPGLSFPEQSADPRGDLAALRAAGVVVRQDGFAAEDSPIRHRTNEVLPT